MGLIPDEIIQQIRDRVDLVELVGRFVSLKKAGRNYKGLCPFHGEKTPSFHVTPERRTFHCFGCGVGGDAIAFLMKIENLDFREAARELARERGIEIPRTGGGEPGLTASLHAANQAAQAAYRAALAAPDAPALAYLAGRGIDAATIERFGIGFAPDRWDFLVQRLREQRIPAEIGERAGLLAARASGGHYDRLRGRVTFPIRDTRGRILGFGGRALDPKQEAKYLNTPESPLFRKREVFYGFPDALDPIRRGDCAVVVEGYFDLIALHHAGVEAALATCGTALSAEHAHALRRHARQVVLLFDGDEAGQRAMRRALEVLLPEGLRVRTVALPAGEDPDSFLRREGAAALRKLVDEAGPALDLVIGQALAAGCATPAQKADAVDAVAPLLALVPGAVERAAFAQQLALAVGVDARHVESAVGAARRGEEPRAAVPIPVRRRGPEDRHVEQLLRCLIEHLHLSQRVPADEIATLVASEPARALLEALLEAAGRGPALDVEAIAERLGGEASALLRALAAADEALAEEAAARTVDDTLRKLRERRQRAERNAVTAALRKPNADQAALLAEKQRQLEERSHAKPPRLATTQ